MIIFSVFWDLCCMQAMVIGIQRGAKIPSLSTAALALNVLLLSLQFSFAFYMSYIRPHVSD
jgi:hypothetical protein